MKLEESLKQMKEMSKEREYEIKILRREREENLTQIFDLKLENKRLKVGIPLLTDLLE